MTKSESEWSREELLEMVKKYRKRLEVDRHFEEKDGDLQIVMHPIGDDFTPDKIDCLKIELDAMENDDGD